MDAALIIPTIFTCQSCNWEGEETELDVFSNSKTETLVCCPRCQFLDLRVVNNIDKVD